MQNNRGRDLYFTSTTAVLLLLILGLTLSPVNALADGESRKATKNEKAFYASVMETMIKVIPRGPEGWYVDQMENSEVDDVSTGSEKYPFQVSFYRSWEDTQRRQKANEEIQTELGKAMTTMMANPETKKLYKENDRLAAEFGEAFGKNDKAKLERVQKELEVVQGKIQVITSAQDKEIDDIIRTKSPHDVRCRVDIKVNEFAESFYDSISQESPIAGAKVIRTPGEYSKNSGWREGTTYVFLGKNWQLKRNGGSYMEAKKTIDVPSLVVQTIIVEVQADPHRAAAILEKINWEALKKLMKN
jgi:hypothetical protein